MESLGLIVENKKKVSQFFLGHDSTKRLSSFTDLQDDAVHADRSTIKHVWSSSFMDKTKDELIEEFLKLNKK